jgi:hypothetical protein
MGKGCVHGPCWWRKLVTHIYECRDSSYTVRRDVSNQVPTRWFRRAGNRLQDQSKKIHLTAGASAVQGSERCDNLAHGWYTTRKRTALLRSNDGTTGALPTC